MFFFMLAQTQYYRQLVTALVLPTLLVTNALILHYIFVSLWS